MNSFHTPVLLKEISDYLRIEKGKKYIDATIGGGGHALEIVRRGGVVLGIDCDQEAIDYIKLKVKPKKNLILVKGNFRDIDKIAHLKGFDQAQLAFDKVAGIVFDLGMSSHQVDEAKRGFSFLKEGPLDMRMDRSLTVWAKDIIQVLTKGELYELFSKLGEESNARDVSEHIVRARRVKPIETTQELVEIIDEVKPRWRFSNIHPATKIFQALRLAVNDDLTALKEALPKGVKLLEKNGRLLVISFQSLEDRIVKRSFIEFSKNGLGKIITKKPIVPNAEEINKNIRARSAKLRVFETH